MCVCVCVLQPPKKQGIVEKKKRSISDRIQCDPAKTVPSSLLVILDRGLRANAECGDHPEVSHKLPLAL